jgi:magnesium transporter
MKQKKATKRSSKSGMPPGSLVHIGRILREDTKISVFTYNENAFSESVVDSIDDAFAKKAPDSVTWINVDGIQDVGLLQRLGDHFHIHPLVLEDIANTSQRPKVEDYENYLYAVLRMLYYDKDTGRLSGEQVSLIAGDHYVLSLQEGDEKRYDVFESVRDRIRSGLGKIRKVGPDFLMYSLIDAIVDNYFEAIEILEDKIQETENMVTSKDNEDVLKLIQNLKRETMILSKSIWPLREVTSMLQKDDIIHVGPATHIYFRDVYDHVVQLIDTIETIREIISTMLDTYLSTLSNRLNEVMKVLTIISTVFIPLTFIVGVYGMNFRYMPEIQSPWGYPAVWVIMVIVAVLMLRYFKKKKWI